MRQSRKFPVAYPVQFIHHQKMKKVLAISSLFTIAVLASSCDSTGSASGGEGYYAPAPQSSVERTAQIQNQFGEIRRSGIR